MSKSTKPTLGGALFAKPTTETSATEDGPQIPEGSEILDPQTSARRYWRDPLTGTQREIWRPGRLFASEHVLQATANTSTGDGDGDVEHDHFERRGPIAPIDKRWRLYQVSCLPHSMASSPRPHHENATRSCNHHSLDAANTADSFPDLSSSASRSLPPTSS